MKVSTKQVKAARALLGWSQEALSEQSSVPLSTIKRIESSDADILKGSAANAWKIQEALEGGGIQFIPENGGGAGVRLRERAKK